MTATRIYVAEWHFGDERWVFDVGAHLRLRCDFLESEGLAGLAELWDADILRDVRYTLGDGTVEHTTLLVGVITSILTLECRYTNPTGGHPIPHSGSAHNVRQARGWTGDVDFRKGVVTGFLIDLELSA